MNAIAAKTAKPPFPAAFRRVVACVLFTLAAGASQAAKDTPFGVEMIPANFPNSTVDDTARSLALTSLIGSHSSKIGHWDSVSFDKLASLAQAMRLYGLKTVLQMGTTFLGDPAPPPGYVKSFADPDTRARFLADVTLLAQAQPDYLVLTTEANLMHRFNRAEFENYRSLYTQAYNLVKTWSPNTKVGVSYLYTLWFFNFHIEGVDVPGMLTPYDFVAFTTYPEWLVREGYFASIADIPPNWYGTSRVAYPDARIVFSEVGWASKVRGTPEIQVEYLRNLPRLMSTTHPELITWAVLHDVEFYSRDLLTPEATAFLVSIGVDIDALFAHFNAMGLLDGYGNPKPGLYEAARLVFPTP